MFPDMRAVVQTPIHAFTNVNHTCVAHAFLPSANATPTYCAVCQADYVMSHSFLCVQCESRAAHVQFAISILVLLVLAIICSFVLRYLWHIDASASLLQPDRFSQQHPQQQKPLMSKTLLLSRSFDKLRIPLVVIQILAQLVSITGVQFPEVYSQYLGWMNLIMFFDVRWLLSAGCYIKVSFFKKLVLTTVLPLVALTLLALVHLIVRFRIRSLATARLQLDCTQQAIAKHSQAFLVFTFLIYAPVLTVVFQTFACDHLGGTDQGWLRADYSTSCESDEYHVYRTYAKVMIAVYPIGIPLLYAYLLWQHRAQLKCAKAATASQSNSSLQIANFLWLPYKPHAYWWEVVECIRRLALTGCLVFIAPGDPTQSAYACAFAVVTTVLYGMVAPLRSRTDSNSYWIGSALIFMTIFVALLLQAEYAQADQSTVGILSVLLVALNVLLVLGVLIQILVSVQLLLCTAAQKRCSADVSDSNINININDDSTEAAELQLQHIALSYRDDSIGHRIEDISRSPRDHVPGIETAAQSH
eukprot:12009-Heterococcus_DN1.PRE.1